ncbi:unnamed protein product [Peniophora sp. CBMAI 1063]|nr:unnamed protein product [Peniophora sp. CBMAI 1063]
MQKIISQSANKDKVIYGEVLPAGKAICPLKDRIERYEKPEAFVRGERRVYLWDNLESCLGLLLSRFRIVNFQDNTVRR